MNERRRAKLDVGRSGLSAAEGGTTRGRRPVQHRPRGAVLAAAGLLALVVVLLATPDAAAWVFGAWVLVLAGVAVLGTYYVVLIGRARRAVTRGILKS